MIILSSITFLHVQLLSNINVNRVTDFMLMERVTEVIRNSLHCLQLDRNMWHIYVKSQKIRDQLLVEGIFIRNISVTRLDTNPYSSGNHFFCRQRRATVQMLNLIVLFPTVYMFVSSAQQPEIGEA